MNDIDAEFPEHGSDRETIEAIAAGRSDGDNRVVDREGRLVPIVHPSASDKIRGRQKPEESRNAGQAS